jgi:hypothetical protein
MTDADRLRPATPLLTAASRPAAGGPYCLPCRLTPQNPSARRLDAPHANPRGNPHGLHSRNDQSRPTIYRRLASSPQVLDGLIAQRQVNHSTVAIQELMHTVGVLSPSDARTARVIAEIGKQIRAMPPHRIFAPDTEVLGRAALLSGILCRLQGYGKDGKLRALQDCVLFLQAQKLGLVVLTANVSNYDILLQLIPAGRALFYRRK